MSRAIAAFLILGLAAGCGSTDAPASDAGAPPRDAGAMRDAPGIDGPLDIYPDSGVAPDSGGPRRDAGPGTVVPAASCSQEDVQAALDAAARGDTVSVPPGTCTWTTGVTITRGVALVGPGGGGTVITDATDQALGIEPDATAIAGGDVIEVTGLTFDGGGRASGEVVGVSAPNDTPFHGLKIHDNEFREMAWGTRCFLVSGSVYGVVYSNDFDRVAELIGYFSGDGSSWSAHYPALPAFGDEEKLYFEDNVIHFSSAWTDEPGWIETGQGAPGIAVRYNSFDHTHVSAGYHEGWDIHGLQTPPACEQYSTISAEYYGNVRVGFDGGRLMNLRGGWLLMFDNAISGSTAPSVEINEYSCDSCASGGEGFPQHVNNTYVWNNFFNGSTAMDIGVSMDACASYSITEERDFYNASAACSGSGTCVGGIGAGATAPTGSCTAGAAYWVTDHSPATGLPVTLTELRTVAQAGRLYRCDATGAWALYYAPYAYPHPLRGGG